MNPFAALWGLIIAAVGVVALGINIGWWPSSIWTSLERFWPVLLVILGIRLLVRSSIAFFLLSLGVLALLAWAVAVHAISPATTNWVSQWHFSSNSQSTTTETTTFQSDADASASDTLSIVLGGHFDVTVSGQDTTKVSVNLTGPKQIIDSLSLKKDGSTITLREVSPPSFLFFSPKAAIVSGTITLPAQTALNTTLSGLTQVHVINHKSKVTIKGAGSTSVDFTGSESTDPSVDVSGSGKITLDQCSGQATVKISGAGDVTANTCTLAKINIDASGAGSVKIDGGSIVDLDAHTSGASEIKLPKPTGKINQDSSGSSEINYF